MYLIRTYLPFICCSIIFIACFHLTAREIEQPLTGPNLLAPQPMPGGLGNGGLGPMPAGPYKPEDIAAQDEFNQLLEELNQMPEEKLHELEQQLQAEVKRELESMTPERRKEFDREMADFWKTQGVDPNQLPSLDEMLGIQTPDQKTADTSYVPAETPEAMQKVRAVPTDYMADDAADVLDKLLARLESLRRKMASYPQATRKLQAWKEAIDDLVYFLKVMDQPEHHERLVTQDFLPLFKHLRTLQQELTSTEPHIASGIKSSHESPYDVLRVSPTAPDEDIKQAYEQYLKQYDPVTLQAQLEEEDFEPTEIEGRVKAAKLNIRTMREAYEKVSNPKIRAQTDRALAAEYEQSHAGKEKSHGAMNALVNALSQAIYQKNVLEDIQRFMKKYEPVKLEQRKKMEAAESKRRKEQEDAGKIRPTQTPNISNEPYYLPGGPAYQPASAGGYYPGGAYGAPAAQRGYGQAIEPAKSDTGGGKSAPGKLSIKDDKEKEKDKEKKETAAAATDKKDKDKKQSPADWGTALQALSKELDLLDAEVTVYDSTATNKLRPQLETIAKLQSEIASQAEAPAEDSEKSEEKENAAEATQALITFLEASPRTELVQKAMDKFAKAEEKVTSDKLKIQNKEKMIADVVQKPAFGMLTLVASATQPAPTRGTGAKQTSALDATPKTKKLIEATTAMITKLVPATEEKSAA